LTTKVERDRRVAVLERAIAERGWSLQLKRAMAGEFGVSPRTIDRYRDELVAGYRKELDGEELDFRRAEFLGRLRGHQRTCLATGRMGPLSSMLNLEARITGADVPMQPRLEDQVGSLTRDQLLADLANDLTPGEIAKLQAIKEDR
jgi:hypothetical protein